MAGDLEPRTVGSSLCSLQSEGHVQLWPRIPCTLAAATRARGEPGSQDGVPGSLRPGQSWLQGRVDSHPCLREKRSSVCSHIPAPCPSLLGDKKEINLLPVKFSQTGHSLVVCFGG